ncbi:MAG: MFS transporter [Novosphingobium sp.]
MSIGSAISSIDNGFVNIALPTMAREMGVAPASTVLIVTIFQLMLMMTVLPFASLGDRIGLRRLYQTGQALFAAAALLCFFAKSLPFLVAVRGLMGLGAAMINSVSSALIRMIYPRDRLGVGLSFNTVIAASSASAAPVIGGLLLAEVSWPWLFAALVPLALLSLAFGHGSLPETDPHDAPFDMKAALLCAAMFGLFVVGVQIGVHGGSLTLAIAVTALSVPVGVIFVRREMGQEIPVLPIDLLREKLIVLPLCASLLVHLSTISLMLTMPFRLQHAYGYSPVEAGLAIAPWSIVMMVVAPAAGAMSDRFRPGLLSSVGMAVALAGTLSLVFLPEHPDHFDIGWRFVLTGTGYGLFFSPNSRQIIAGAPVRRAAAAGAIMQTFRLSGQLLGSTVAALWLALDLGDGLAPPLAAAILAIPTGILCLMVLGAAGRNASSGVA